MCIELTPQAPILPSIQKSIPVVTLFDRFMSLVMFGILQGAVVDPLPLTSPGETMRVRPSPPD